MISAGTSKRTARCRWPIRTIRKRVASRPGCPKSAKHCSTAVFDNRAAQRLFNRFQDADNRQRVLTINSQDASILAIPWELLHDPSGIFLFREKPHISAGRRISGATGGRQPFRVESKDHLHLLFVVSRPTDAGFIDPRADPRAVLDALENHAAARVTWEFLRPATLNAFVERLDDEIKPSVVILHFDGHGVFQQVSEEDAKEDPSVLQRYYPLANYLYREDQQNPHQARAIARRELPNLLYAIDRALDARDADAVGFVDSVNRFLDYFGMTREAARLTRRGEQAGGQRGSNAWFLAQSNRGEQLLAAGCVQQAAEIFADILETLGDQPSYNRALTLGRLGRCYAAGGRPDLAEATYRQGIAVTEQIEPSDSVKRHRGALHTDLADVLTDQGKYAEARAQYELGLEHAKELNDLRGQGVVLGQLGTLAMVEGDLADAVKRHHETLELFQRLGEPAMEAVAQHQLGIVFQEAREWG